MSDDNQETPKAIDQDFAEPATKREKEQSRVVRELSDKDKGGLSMQVKVSSPFTSYFNGRAFSISGVNATGPFDVLPRHHNFISLLEPSTLVVRTVDGSEQKIEISGGLLHVKANKAVVFLDV
jgi:hypothetical protein